MKTLEYKGYKAKIEYNSDSNSFLGIVLSIHRVRVTFQGNTLEEAKKAFEKTIDDRMYKKNDRKSYIKEYWQRPEVKKKHNERERIRAKTQREKEQKRQWQIKNRSYATCYANSYMFLKRMGLHRSDVPDDVFNALKSTYALKAKVKELRSKE